MELNREQIIKALEHCGDDTLPCRGCPYADNTSECHNLFKNAISLIKELTEENEEKDETIAGLIGTIKDAYGFAVREMKARLDKNLIAIKDHTGKIGLVVLDRDIDQIAKEMLEGEK